MATTLDTVMEKLNEMADKLSQVAAVVGISGDSHPYQRILDKEQPVGTIEAPPAQIEGLKPSEQMAAAKDAEGNKVDLNTMGAPVVPIAGEMPSEEVTEENQAEKDAPATSENLSAKTPAPTTTRTTTTKP